MPTHWYQGKVAEIKQLSATTRQFTVAIIEEEGVFDFLPGQFVTMDLPVSEKRLHRWRSYSIANHPNQHNVLEFCIVRSEDGLGTKYLFDDVGVGSLLKFKGPDGGFVLPKDLDKEIIMICTGTGVAPFRSMIQYIRNNALQFRKIHLIFGTRLLDGLLYEDEFKSFASEKDAFLYDAVLSREQHAGYHHGYVHDVYRQKYGDVHKDRHFYICGWSKMIDQAVENLIIHMGYDKSQIHYELYG